jgi:hypothetical protein
MPPLAYRVLKQLTLPLRERTFTDRCGLLPRLSETHFFDITDVQHAAYLLSQNPAAFQGAPATTFLPAPKTWIETQAWKKDHSKFVPEARGDRLNEDTRLAWFICEKKGGGFEFCWIMQSGVQNYFGTWSDTFLNIDLTCKWSSDPQYWAPEQLIPVYLLFINSPKVIGRRQHMPHRALERRLTQKMGRGMFPLRAWTEIKLEIGAPKDESGKPSTEAHLTGERALHFCRSHLRVRLGRLEIVRAHWRGDPALGIKQSRYKLVMPRS